MAKISKYKHIPVEIVRMWGNIKARCYNVKNPGYKKCGNIGIRVYEEWKENIEAFYNWAIQEGFKVNNNMRIKRIDLTKDFDPSNCKIIKEIDPIEYIGKRFNKLVVMGFGTNDCDKNDKYMSCKCDCGNISNIRLCDLINKKITACVYCTNGKRYGINSHPLNSVYHCMRTRCYNKNDSSYCNYGGRGIIICNEWLNSYEAFYDWAIANGYKKGLSIDRIDVNGNYCPENCRWATPSQQSINRRKSNLNTSGYTGIIASIVKNRFFGWISTVAINNKSIYLGKYKTQKEALEVRNKYIIDNNLEHPIQEYKGEIGQFKEQDLTKEVKYNKLSYHKSVYRGIFLTKRYNKYVAWIRVNKVRIEIGRFKTQKEALEARNKYIIDNGLDYPIQEYKGEIDSVNN